MRPQSLVWFDRLYLGAVGIGVVSGVLNFSDSQKLLAKNGSTAVLGSSFLFITLGFSWAISLLIWYFISRRGSNIARWIWTVMMGFSLLSLPVLFTQSVSGVLPGWRLAITLVTYGLNIGALVFLFRPDAQLWFAKQPQVDASVFE